MPVSSYVSDAAQERYDAWRTTAPEDGPEPTDDDFLDARHEIMIDMLTDGGQRANEIAELMEPEGFVGLIKLVLSVDQPPPDDEMAAALKIIADDIRLSLDVVAQREAERMMLERIELAKDDDNRE